MNWRILALVLVTLIWGTTFVVIKETLTAMPASLLLALRFGFSWLMMLWVRPKKESWRMGITLGVLAFLSYTTQTIGMVYTTASKAAFITGLSVILTPIFVNIHARTKPKPSIYIAAVLAVAGLALLSFSSGGTNISPQVGFNIGDVWILGCAVSYAITIIYIEQATHEHDLLQAIALQYYPLAILSWLWALPHIHLLPTLGWQHYAAIGYLAVIATVLTSLLHLWAQRKVSASLTALIFVLEPVFASIFAAWFLGETLGRWGYLGAALIFLAMIVSEIRLPNRLRIGKGKFFP